jgi:hypothetical protein
MQSILSTLQQNEAPFYCYLSKEYSHSKQMHCKWVLCQLPSLYATTIRLPISSNEMCQLLRVRLSRCKLQTEIQMRKMRGKTQYEGMWQYCSSMRPLQGLTWRYECPVRMAEKHRLEELRDRSPDLFTV